MTKNDFIRAIIPYYIIEKPKTKNQPTKEKNPKKLQRCYILNLSIKKDDMLISEQHRFCKALRNVKFRLAQQTEQDPCSLGWHLHFASLKYTYSTKYTKSCF